MKANITTVSNRTPSYYRARVAAIGEALAYELSLPESREGQMRIAYLRNGHEPDRFLREGTTYYNFKLEQIGQKTGSKTKNEGVFYWPSIEQRAKEIQSTNNQSPLTELEQHTYDTYFQLHPEKVCGTQQGGSGYSFPVRTIGSRADIEQAIDATLNKKLVYGTKSNKVSISDKDIDLQEELIITENIKKTIAFYEEYFKTTTDSSLSREYKENKKMLASSKKQLAIQNEIILPYADKLVRAKNPANSPSLILAKAKAKAILIKMKMQSELGKVVKNEDGLFTEIDVTLKKEYIPELVGKNAAITNSNMAFEYITKAFKYLNYKEEVIILLLNLRNNIIGWHNLSKGGVKSSIIDIPQLVGVVGKSNATGVIMAHNHPSGSLVPSPADIASSKKVKETLKQMDVVLLDHVIVAQEPNEKNPETKYYSLAEHDQL